MMQFLMNGLGTILCTLAASFVYLASPNQQWFARAVMTPRRSVLAAVASLVFAWLAFASHMSGLSSTFTVLTVMMLLLGLIPFLTRFALPMGAMDKARSSIQKHALSSSYRAQWWLRLGGVGIMGFCLAVGIAGIFAVFSAGEMTDTVKSQFVMWLITPVWLTVVSIGFFHRSASRLLIKLAVANVLVFLVVGWGQFSL